MDLYGLIGKDLSHSRSGLLFTKKFAELQLHARYELFPLDEIDDLPSLIEKHKELIGLNVTIPYKRSVMAFIDKIDNAAKKIGAVNTIKILRKGKYTELIGFNTDVHGFTTAIEPLLQGRHDVNKALVLGTGGASKAVQYVLSTLGVNYTEVSRESKKAGQLTYPMVTPSILKTHLLIINTTPVGMFPNQSIAPDLMYKYIGSDHILIDLIYNPAETKFLELGKQAGAATLNGQTMFEKQAEESWKIWQ
jgi:shikimate dehydrogenase